MKLQAICPGSHHLVTMSCRNAYIKLSNCMYPLAGDDLEAVFLEILGTVLLKGLVEFDTVGTVTLEISTCSHLQTKEFNVSQ